VGNLIGAIPTIFMVVFTAVLGALMIRVQGYTTLTKVRTSLARGEIPATPMLEGVILLISGALLLTPGFFTDTLGFICLIPRLRRRVIKGFLSRAVWMGMHDPSNPSTQGGGPRTIEGEFTRDKDS